MACEIEAAVRLLRSDKIKNKAAKDDINAIIEKHKSEGITEATSSDQENFVNHSGGAYGADKVWGDVGAKYGVTSNHYYHGERGEKNAPEGNTPISETDYNEGRFKVAEAAKLNWGYQYKSMKDVRLVRNWSQVKYSDAVYAVAPMVNKGEVLLPGNRTANFDGAVKGGTGYAVGMAIIAKKPVYVFDDGKTNQWYTYNYDTKTMEPTTTPTLTKNFAGIGTRGITEAGKKAIADVYEQTLGDKAKQTPSETVADVAPSMDAKDELRRELEAVDTSKVVAKASGTAKNSVWVMRNGKPVDFGNPFVTDEKFKKSSEQFNVGGNNEATFTFYNWIKFNKLPDGYDGNVTRLKVRRNRIIENLNKIKNADELIYKGTSHKNGELTLSHVHALIKLADERGAKQEAVEETTVQEPVKESGVQESVNIYAGTDENADLSNFAIRPFKRKGHDQTYQSVEQYFQLAKFAYVKEDYQMSDEDLAFNEKLEAEMKNTTNGARLKALGKRVKGLIVKDWNEEADNIMYIGLEESFLQNPEAAKRLVGTKNAKLTHKQDKSRWGKVFPELLMEVRSKLQNNVKVEETVATETIDSVKTDRNTFKDIGDVLKTYGDDWTTVVGQDAVGISGSTGDLYKRNKRKKILTMSGEFWNYLGFDKREFNMLEKAHATIEAYNKMESRKKPTARQMEVYEKFKGIHPDVLQEAATYAEQAMSENVKGSAQFDGMYFANKNRVSRDTASAMEGKTIVLRRRGENAQTTVFVDKATYVQSTDSIEIETKDPIAGKRMNAKFYVNAQNGKNTDWEIDGYSRVTGMKYSDPEGLDARPGMDENDVLHSMDVVDPKNNIDELAVKYQERDMEEGKGIQSEEFFEFTGSLIKQYTNVANKIDMGNIDIEVFTNSLLETAGEVDLNIDKIRMRWNSMSTSASSTEIFIHELSHVMAKGVFQENEQLRTLISDLREAAIENGVDEKIFLENKDTPTTMELEIAKKKFDYVFFGEEEEFYAYVVSNEKVYDAIKDVRITKELYGKAKNAGVDAKEAKGLGKILEVLTRVVNKLWLGLTGRSKKGSMVVADMVRTVAQTAIELDSKERTEAQEQEGKVSRVYHELDNRLADLLEKKEGYLDAFAEKAGKYTKRVETSLRKIGVIDAAIESGVLGYAFRSITLDTTKKNVTKMYEVFRQSKNYIEKKTMSTRTALKELLEDMYKDVSDTDKTMIKVLTVDLDISSINDIDEVALMLKDEVQLEKRIAELENTIPEDRIEQLKGLAHYMMYGETIVANQQMNAQNVMMRFDDVEIKSKARKKIYDDHRESIEAADKLATMYALQLMSEGDKKLAVAALENKNNSETIVGTMNMYKNYIDDMRLQTHIGMYDPINKGYNKAEDGELKYALVPEAEVEAQLSVNMKLVDDHYDYHILRRYKNVSMAERMSNVQPHIVVDGVKYYMMKGRLRETGIQEGAIGIISTTAEGITLSSLFRKNFGLNEKETMLDGSLDKKIQSTISALSKNGNSVNLDLDNVHSLVPVYNHNGKVIDYRIQMTKLQKAIELDQSNHVEDVLSNTFSRSTKTHLTKEYNEVVVETILEHAAENIEKDPDAFEVIEEYTKEMELNGVKYEKRHERWDRLPEYTKEYIASRLGVRGISIHKNFVELMTGEKDITLGNFKMGSFDMKKHPKARARIMALESYIREVLSMVKRTMILLDAGIVVGNIMSNATVAAIHGVDPITYVKEMKRKWQQINEYNDLQRTRATLEVELKAGKDVAGRIKGITKRIENHPFNELVEDGQFTPIAEDINVDDKPQGTLMQGFDGAIGDMKFGDLIKRARNVLYIDKSSFLGRLALKNTQYQDAMTRSIIKDAMEKKVAKRNGIKVSELTPKMKQEILNYLDQLLVNYGYTMNRWWTYLEKVTGVLFLRYYFGQAKALVSMTTKNPLGVLGLGAEQSVGVDVWDPFETYSDNPLNAFSVRFALDDAVPKLIEPNLADIFKMP